MPKSRNRKNHSQKVEAYHQRQRATANKIRKYREELMSKLIEASKQHETEEAPNPVVTNETETAIAEAKAKRGRKKKSEVSE